jgi:uncharacterized iron-regulated protein
MRHRSLRLLAVLMLSLVFVQLSVAEEDEFNLERLPLGNPATKYSFGAVKLHQIYDSGANRHLAPTEFFNKIRDQRIVMVGESHTNGEHHRVQFEVIKGLVAAGKPVCLALEMFTAAQNQALQAFIEGKYPREDFMDSTGWFETWGYDFRMYQPIFEFAREHKIKIYGVNLDRDYVSKIGRSGLNGLSATERQQLPAIDTTHAEHRFLIKAYFSGSDATAPEFFANKYLAQCAWDAVMAEGAVKAARENPAAVVVLLAGSGHVAYNLGIGKVILQQSKFPFVSVLAVEVPAKKEENLIEIMHQHRKKEKPGEAKKMPPAMMKMMQAATDSTPHQIVIRSLADFVWGVPDTDGQPAFPSLGIRIGEKNETGIAIDNVFPKSIAEKNGIQAGDTLLAVDGNAFTSTTEFKKYLQTRNWNDSIQISLARGEQKIELSFMLKWEKETE